jgi:predicted secreted Zn-dependent protease
VRGQTGPDLLRHEQGHYNITALGARDYYNELLTITAAHCSEINGHAQTLRQQIQAQIDETDIRYDTRTENGTKGSVQRTWDSQIRATMLNLNGTLSDLP